ncbi:hypothetical protein [Labrys neptuniae]
MDSLNSWLPPQLFTLAGLLLVVGVVLMLIWRAINRPSLGGGKSGRQSRLGVVDSYGVGTRQLVLVRRDNVEHLIMIGGPNDVVVESSILRARATGQAPRPATPATTPSPLQERAAAIAAAPRQVEEDFARPAPTPAAPAHVTKVETSVAPVAPPTPAPTPAPVTTTAPATTAAPSQRASVVPPREPGFFQRATSRLPNFSRPAAGASAAAAAPALAEDEEPRATIDAAHFEELLSGGEPAAAATTPKPATAAPAATTTAKPKAEPDFGVAEGFDLEPAPDAEAQDDLPPPPTTTTRLTLPEIRLPDLRLPEWRRPEATPAPTPAPAPTRPAAELRVEPRFSPDPRPSSEPPRAPSGGRIEPSLGTPQPRVQADSSARAEPFRVGERLTTPTRPTTTQPTQTPSAPSVTAAPTSAPTPAPTPAPTEDPFASLEEEMASLLGRNRDDGKKV